MKSETESLVRVIKKSMEAAGAPMLRDLTELERLQMGGKNVVDYARRTQTRAAELLQEELLAARPKFGYRDNAGHKINGLIESYFLTAPLIGINNFTRALPMFACSVIVLSKEPAEVDTPADPTAEPAPPQPAAWRIDVAAIYQPLLDDFFVADGKEAFHNQKWLRLAATTSASSARATPTTRLLHSNQPKNGEENFGVAGLELCYLAGNRIDGYRGDKSPLMETAAGLFVAITAGRKILDGAGHPITAATLAPMCHHLLSHPTAVVSFAAM